MIVYTLKVSESWRIGKDAKSLHPRLAGLVATAAPPVQTTMFCCFPSFRHLC
jgi:hypothetical protein